MEYCIDPVVFVAGQSGRDSRHVSNLLRLLDGGATIPFIARYRKEMTGSMDEVEVGAVKELYEQFKELERRKKTVLEAIAQQGALSPELRRQVEACRDGRALEDIYLPYKPKRQTRAMKAKAKGLEPLADWLTRQEAGDVEERAGRFLGDEVETVEAALQGARDIIAERVNENERARDMVRRVFERTARVVSKVAKGKEAEGEKYADYFDSGEALRRCPSPRRRAIRRGVRAGCLRVALAVDDEEAVGKLRKYFVKARCGAAAQVALAVEDGYKRLLFPSIESEFLQSAKEKADGEAIKVFAENLRQLLLAPPLGNKRVVGIDPGFRTGCKVVCLDETGNLLHNETIFPHPPQNERKQAGAKLVKIDPKSIGVGQYQHDVDQTRLKEALDRVVESCVNKVGVNVNTASKYLLTYVSGLGPTLAENVVEYIRENGPFRSRAELRKVKRMGEKAFEQCAGFLRIEGAENPLDNSSVHPESYAVVERMAADLGMPVGELIGNAAACDRVELARYVDDRVGLPTLQDILDELRKPGRDPRSPAKVFSFADNVHSIDDLAEGMILPGIVTNITAFGVFVDVGVKQDGLVHISELADRYVANPADVVSLHQHVTVKVLQVDKGRRRVSLSMKQA